MAAFVKKSMVTPSQSPRVCISILNWKNTADTTTCIQSLQGMEYIDHQIVVLDNETSSESVSALQNIDNIKIIPSTKNLGFAGGHNRVMQWATDQGFDYVWLLNNDAISQPGCLPKLIDYAQRNKESALLSPILLDSAPPHNPQHVTSILNETKTGAHEYLDVNIAKKMQHDFPDKVILWGTALLVRTASLKKLGYLDEKLFAYAEDTDYALRAISLGFRNAVVFNATVLHESPTPPRKPHYYYYTHRNSIAIAKKHAGRINTLKLIYWNLRLAKKQLSIINDKADISHALRLGIWHGWTNQFGEFTAQRSMPILGDILVKTALKLA